MKTSLIAAAETQMSKTSETAAVNASAEKANLNPSMQR